MTRVLVIEDDIDSQEVYTEILETGDFEIVAKGLVENIVKNCK